MLSHLPADLDGLWESQPQVHPLLHKEEVSESTSSIISTFSWWVQDLVMSVATQADYRLRQHAV
jgi:hypothetical protein